MKQEARPLNQKQRRHGIGIAILSIFLIAILLGFLFFPSSVHICYEDTVMEYSLTETDLAIPHEISIEGDYYSSILGKDRFRGSFYISDVKKLSREKNNAHFSFDPRYRYSPTFLDSYGQPLDTEVSTIFFDKNFQRLAIQFADLYTDNDGSISRVTSWDTSTFCVAGATSREDAVSQYTRLLNEKPLEKR